MKKRFINNNLVPNSNWLCFDTNKKIRETSKDLEFPLNQEDIDYIQKMVSYVDKSYENQEKKYNIRPGIAIAGSQVHYMKKVAYVHFDDEKGIERELLFANPVIIETSYNKSYLPSGEGCLSVAIDKNGIVPRTETIHFKAIDIYTEKEIEVKADGLYAICLQHEIDHMFGKLYYDRINVFNKQYVDENWKKVK